MAPCAQEPKVRVEHAVGMSEGEKESRARRLAEEQACAEQLVRLRFPEGYCCPCGSRRYRHRRDRPRALVCKTCGASRSVTAGTLLHGTHLPLSKWFDAARCFSWLKGISARRLAARLGVDKESAWQLLHRIRAALRSDQVLLQGTTRQGVTLVRCRRPCVDPLVEVAILVDECDRPRVLPGRPRLPNGLGLQVLERAQAETFWRTYVALGGDIAARSRDRRQVEHSDWFARDGVVVSDPTHASVVQFRVWMQHRLKRAYRQVSQRWLDRYLDAFCSLWRRWGAVPATRAADEVGRMLIGSCLERGRARFDQLVPSLPRAKRSPDALASP